MPVKKAILLVGGRGTRLAPLTDLTPKPMLPLAGVPFSAHQIAKAKAAGITEIVLATSYLSEVFKPYFGDGSELDIKISYAQEIKPLGTGGAIRNAAQHLKVAPDDVILVFNGDVLSGHDLQKQLDFHINSDADLTLYLTRVRDARAYGCVLLDEELNVLKFLEKMENPVADTINAGCYIFRGKVIENIPLNTVVSVERETFPTLLKSGAHVKGFLEASYWLDIGTPKALVQGSKDLVLGRVRSPATPMQYFHQAGFIAMPGAKIDSSATISDGSVISEMAEIEHGSTISGSIIGKGAFIGSGSQIIDCVVADGTKIPSNTAVTSEFLGF